MPSEYPKPPFPSQKQPMPGSTGKMDPRPDHGEESYKGSGKLKGLKAIITGGDSGIGRAVAIAYAREGADVLIAYADAGTSFRVALLPLPVLFALYTGRTGSLVVFGVVRAACILAATV